MVQMSVSESVSQSFRNSCVHILSKSIVLICLKLIHFVGIGLPMNPFAFGDHTPTHPPLLSKK